MPVEAPEGTAASRSRSVWDSVRRLEERRDVVAEPPIETEAQKTKREAATDIVAASQAAAQAQLYEVLAAIAPPDVQAATDTIADVEALAFDLYDLILDGDLYDAHQAVRALVTERLRALTRDLPEIIEYLPPAPSSATAPGAVGDAGEAMRQRPLTSFPPASVAHRPRPSPPRARDGGGPGRRLR